jgi:hypothetical protein
LKWELATNIFATGRQPRDLTRLVTTQHEKRFTAFRDQEFSFDMGPRAVNRISNLHGMRGAQFAEDAIIVTHAIGRIPSENQIGELFTTIDSEAISAVHEAILSSAYRR